MALKRNVLTRVIADLSPGPRPTRHVHNAYGAYADNSLTNDRFMRRLRALLKRSVVSWRPIKKKSHAVFYNSEGPPPACGCNPPYRRRIHNETNAKSLRERCEFRRSTAAHAKPANVLRHRSNDRIGFSLLAGRGPRHGRRDSKTGRASSASTGVVGHIEARRLRHGG